MEVGIELEITHMAQVLSTTPPKGHWLLFITMVQGSRDILNLVGCLFKPATLYTISTVCSHLWWLKSGESPIKNPL
ncbi:hypothetical protein Hdeb2414_s0011g00367221 [Helianthus debilis subsp. tardiflorus]